MSYIYKECVFFFTHFQNVPPISTKFGMVVEDIHASNEIGTHDLSV
jgi:hypothetical protein